MSERRRRVALFGATGSIGRQTLDVLRREPEALELVAVTAGTRLHELVEIAREFSVSLIGVPTHEAAATVRELMPEATVVAHAEVPAAICEPADVVVNAIVGFAGMYITLEALRTGKRLALANKESLVAGAPVVESVRSSGEIVPIDSEHCALHQCLAGSTDRGHPDVRRLILTASGGPFREWSAEQLATATKADALKHPTWQMGEKITVDSSTLMNKGLEVLEAAALFHVDVERIDVVIHPQSIVHSMVEYVDGSTLAQLSRPDMRLAIAYAIGLPTRFDHGWGRLRFDEPMTLSFEPPDHKRFPLLDLAYAAAQRANAAPAWLNAANEVAVDAFLHETITWSEIHDVVATTLDHYDDEPIGTLEELLDNDARARACARERISALH